MSGRSDAERFWPKVDRRGPDDCWWWHGILGFTALAVVSLLIGHLRFTWL